MTRPAVSLSLDWQGDLTFANSAGSPDIRLDSASADVTSPPQALAYALMGCTAMDVVHVIRKGRHDLAALTVRLTGERADEHPRRFLTMRLHFDVTGDVPDQVVQRAIDLSRDRYCTVWNSLRDDIAIDATFEVRPAG